MKLFILMGLACVAFAVNPTIERMKRASEQMHTYHRRPLVSRAEASQRRRLTKGDFYEVTFPTTYSGLNGIYYEKDNFWFRNKNEEETVIFKKSKKEFYVVEDTDHNPTTNKLKEYSKKWHGPFPFIKTTKKNCFPTGDMTLWLHNTKTKKDSKIPGVVTACLRTDIVVKKKNRNTFVLCCKRIRGGICGVLAEGKTGLCATHQH